MLPKPPNSPPKPPKAGPQLLSAAGLEIAWSQGSLSSSMSSTAPSSRFLRSRSHRTALHTRKQKIKNVEDHQGSREKRKNADVSRNICQFPWPSPLQSGQQTNETNKVAVKTSDLRLCKNVRLATPRRITIGRHPS